MQNKLIELSDTAEVVCGSVINDPALPESHKHSLLSVLLDVIKVRLSEAVETIDEQSCELIAKDEEIKRLKSQLGELNSTDESTANLQNAKAS